MDIALLILLPLISVGVLYGVNRWLTDNFIKKYSWFAIIYAVFFFMSYLLLFYKKENNIFSTLYILYAIVLLILSLWDIKEMNVPRVIIGILWLISLCMIFTNKSIINCAFTGVVLSTILIIVYFVSKKKIGLGDILVICGLAFGLGYPTIFRILFIGMFVAMIYGFILVKRKKATIKTEIPFIPFIFVGLILNIVYL